jgi:hypothetical protein
MLILVSMILLTMPTNLRAIAQVGPENDDADSSLREGWLGTIDPWNGIPSELALRFGEAALSAGLEPSKAARLLNDGRFVSAVGAPDQGWGLLEAMIDSPTSIADAWILLREGNERLTASGDTSFQYAFMLRYPRFRNAYLADIGHMIAVRPDGAEVLVDIATGRQVIARDTLGIPIRAPGGAPLPIPSISPQETAGQMWEAAGIDPNDPNPGQDTSAERAAGPTGPGFDFELESDEPSSGLLTPGLYLVVGAFLISWFGYAAVATIRRFRRLKS